MAGIVAVIVSILPDSIEANLEEIKFKARSTLEKQGAKNLSFTEEPIAFGLKSIKLKFAWPEESSTEIIETALVKIHHVSSVKIEDYRRAFG